MNKSIFLLAVLAVIYSNSTLAQKVHDISIKWTKNQVLPDGTELLSFESASYDFENDNYPRIRLLYPVNQGVTGVNIQFNRVSSRPLEFNRFQKIAKYKSLEKEPLWSTEIVYDRGNPKVLVEIIPLIKGSTGEINLVEELNFTYTETRGSRENPIQRNYAENSVLASGEWYKIAVQSDGIYRVTGDFLEELGVNLSNLSSSSINLYGNGGQLLPIQNSDFRHDDLQINPIDVFDGGDGIFNSGDHFLFFGKGSDSWNYSAENEEFEHLKHYYSNRGYYYIGIDIEPAVRISDVDLADSPSTLVLSTFDDYAYHEVNNENFIKSGREYYGEEFDIITDYSFSGPNFSFPNLVDGEEVHIKVDAIGRTLNTGSSSFSISSQGNSTTFSIASVSDSYSSSYARQGDATLSFVPNSGNDNLNVNLSFNKFAANSVGWLNYIRINCKRDLRFVGPQLLFRNVNSVGSGNIGEFKLSNAGNVFRIWEVTDHTQPANINYSMNGSIGEFKVNTDSLRQFIAFSNGNFLSPEGIGSVPNQNLHGMGFPDMVIVSNSDFLTQAQALASLHEQEGLDVEVVTPSQVYNEFSSGNPDITAIKTMMKKLYDEAGNDQNLIPRYLLLFGDGSYDNTNNFEGNTNFVITYQSLNSLAPLVSFVSDDYFGLLDDEEGESNTELVDIGIGRIPVKTVEEANNVVNKIANYMSSNNSGGIGHCSGIGSESTYGDWRNQLVFVGDDEDSNIHMSQCNQLSVTAHNNNPEYNQTKIFLDAYQQESTPGGERYPDANRDLKDNLSKGSLVVTYVGHGGEIGWAHERILDVSTIQNLNNFNSLPVFLTATCEFSRYDDYERTSGGELTLLNPNGGAIALLSTTRLVFSSPNYALSQNFYANAFHDNLNPELRLGDIVRQTKNDTPSSQTSSNKRNFSLLGDPALKISYPKYNVETLMYTDTSGAPIDTLNALSQVRILGRIVDNSGDLISDFNGEIVPVVFDKATEVNTLQNDGGNIFQFNTRRNVIYRGKAGVENGEFSFEFIVPKDINYQFGSGRISYYAVDGNSDAHGYDENIIIGGTADLTNIDENGPQIQLFLNDENFVDGGITNGEPILVAKVFDDNGINTVGNGIGHDITAVIDNNTNNTIRLNDFYESDLNTFKSGVVRYQLPELNPGEHSITFKIWDVYNNSSSKSIDFIVTEENNFTLEHVLNYPNPFTTYTEFFFEHNRHCNALDVEIQVFTVSGKLVKTIRKTVQNEGFRSEGIPWDGKDDYGDKIGKGVYVYRVLVRTPLGEKEEQFEKLVILN